MNNKVEVIAPTSKTMCLKGNVVEFLQTMKTKRQVMTHNAFIIKI